MKICRERSQNIYIKICRQRSQNIYIKICRQRPQNIYIKRCRQRSQNIYIKRCRQRPQNIYRKICRKRFQSIYMKICWERFQSIHIKICRERSQNIYIKYASKGLRTFILNMKGRVSEPNGLRRWLVSHQRHLSSVGFIAFYFDGAVLRDFTAKSCNPLHRNVIYCTALQCSALLCDVLYKQRTSAGGRSSRCLVADGQRDSDGASLRLHHTDSGLWSRRTSCAPLRAGRNGVVSLFLLLALVCPADAADRVLGPVFVYAAWKCTYMSGTFSRRVILTEW